MFFKAPGWSHRSKQLPSTTARFREGSEVSQKCILKNPALQTFSSGWVGVSTAACPQAAAVRRSAKLRREEEKMLQCWKVGLTWALFSWICFCW